MNPWLEDITPETAAMLHAHATAQGLSVDAYLRALLGHGIAENALADMSEEDFGALMEEFAQGTESHHYPYPPVRYNGWLDCFLPVCAYGYVSGR
jgi:hypothetical protein